MPVPIRGYLTLRVEEASGKTQKDQLIWDTTPAGGLPFEAFVKVELRGGVRNVKAQTHKQSLVDDTVTWQEDLKLEVLDGSKELRLMLCREKYNNGKKGTAVIAACGIFVDDILDAVPIDKYFELFKPNAGGEGGFIRISMNYVKITDPALGADVTGQVVARGAVPAAPVAGQKRKGGGFKKFLIALITLGIVGAAAGTTATIISKKKKKE